MLRLVSIIIRFKLYEEQTDKQFEGMKKRAIAVVKSQKKALDERLEKLEKADKKALIKYFKSLVDAYGETAKRDITRTGDKVDKARKLVEKYKDGIPEGKRLGDVKDELIKAGFSAINLSGRTKSSLEKSLKRTAKDFSIEKLEEEWGFGDDASAASKELRELAVNTMSMIKT